MEILRSHHGKSENNFSSTDWYIKTLMKVSAIEVLAEDLHNLMVT